MATNKQYGLVLSSKASAARSKPLVSKLSVFGNDDDDDDKLEEKSGSRPTPKYNVQTDTKKPFLKRQVQADLEKALAEDPNVFEYDSIYDEVQKKKTEHVKHAEKTNADRKSKYIGGLMKAAEMRKKEHERRLEKTVQKEREQEKGMYDDKEAFVTGAYKKKLEERKLEEEKERLKKLLEERMDVTKQEDMSLFYRNILNQTTGGSVVDSSAARIKEESIVPTTSSTASHVPNPDTLYPEDRDDSLSENSVSDSDSCSSNGSLDRKTKELCKKRKNNSNDKHRHKESSKGEPSKDTNIIQCGNATEMNERSSGHRDRKSSESEMRTNDRRRNTDDRREEEEKSNSRREKDSRSKHRYIEEKDSGRDKKRNSNRGEERDDGDRVRETRKYSGRDESKNDEKEKYTDIDSSRHRRNDDRNKRKESKSKCREEEQASRDEGSSSSHPRNHENGERKRQASSSNGRCSDNDGASSKTDLPTSTKLEASNSEAQPSANSTKQSVIKFAKKTVDSALSDARAKYLARKAAVAPVVAEDSD